MKNQMVKIVLFALVLVIGVFQVTTAYSTGNYTDEMKIPYAMDISPEDGADSVERMGDVVDSPYFKHLDFYNMESSDTLTIISKFKTIQQTSEWSCGVASAMMVLSYYDKLGEYTELQLAEMRHDHKPGGTSLMQLKNIFDAIGGFEYESTTDYDNLDDITIETITNYLKDGVPMIVGWGDWGGHYQVIIGYDTMGTEYAGDDVIIMADPYDTTDHNQDGYVIYGAERFYYAWTMFDFFANEERWPNEADRVNEKVFIAAWPTEKE